MLPFITALCPTFRHPTLLASSLALWLAQDYPLDRRELVILDDGQTFDNQEGPGWRLRAAPERLPSLPAKYNELLDLARGETGIFLIWEDDDTYLPGYVSAHVKALESAEFSKPSRVLSDYAWVPDPNCESGGGNMRPQEEAANGRFHSSMAFTADLIRRIGGWPVTNRADFDQQLITKLRENAARIADPWDADGIQYVYGWNTGAAHCQSTMRNPADETWYERGEAAYKHVPFVGKLEPKYDERTIKILRSLGVNP